jgi:enolase
MDVTNQQDIDEKMLALDGTSSKAKLGANAILGVSLAVLDAGSQTLELPLYQYINQVFADINGEKANDANADSNVKYYQWRRAC